MKEHPKKERTLVIIKPDGIQRALIGEIIGRYERLGLKLVGLKMTVPTAEQVEGHYTLDPQWRRVTGEKTINNYKSRGLTPPSGPARNRGGFSKSRRITSRRSTSQVWGACSGASGGNGRHRAA